MARQPVRMFQYST